MAAPALGPKARRPRRTTTIAQIAEQAGVSAPTVSKVINGRSDVAAETRRRVEAAIRDVGYQRPQSTGRRAPLIEVIFHELESEWALEIVRGVERVAGQHHLAVVLSEMQGRRTPGRGWIEGVLARRPTGVIAVFSDLSDVIREQLRSRGIPYVVVDPTGRAAPRHAIGRRYELERRPDGDPAPARPGASPHRRHRRTRVDPVQPSATRRVSRGHGRGRRAGRSGHS